MRKLDRVGGKIFFNSEIMSKEDIITQLQADDIRSIFEELGIEHIYLVGSYARNEQTDISDIDLIYTRKAWKRLGWLYFMRKNQNLSKNFEKKSI